MTSIKEVNEFVTANQVRKICQDTLAPLVKTLEEQVEKLKKQTYELKKQTQKMCHIEKSQQNTQASLRQFNKNLLQLKGEIVELQGIDNRNSLTCSNNFQILKEEINSLKRQTKRRDEKVQENFRGVQDVNKKFKRLEESTQASIQAIRVRLAQIYNNTLDQIRKSSANNKQCYQALQIARKEIHCQRQRYRESTNVIELYLSEKQDFNRKLQEGIDRIMNSATVQQFKELEQRVKNELKGIERTQAAISDLATRKDLKDITIIVRNIEDKLADFAKIIELEMEVDEIKRQFNEKQTQKTGRYLTMQALLNQIQTKVQEIKTKKIEDNTQKQKSQTQILKQQLNGEIEKLKALFEEKVKTTNQKTVIQFNQNLQNITKDIPTRERALKQQLANEVKDMTNKIQKRCMAIQTLGGNLEEQLLFFGNRITRMKSDGQLFQETIKKQYKEVQRYRVETDAKMQQIGRIISSMLQIQSITQALDIYDSCSNLTQKIVYVTYSDGIVYEIERQSTNDLQFFYRKKLLSSKEIKKSVMAGIVQLMDQTIQNHPFLNLQEFKPSRFFLQHILSHYTIQMDKYMKKNTSQLKLSHTMINSESANKTQHRKMQESVNKQMEATSKEKISKNSTSNNQQSKKNYHIKVKKQQKQKSDHPSENRIMTARSSRYGKLNSVCEI